MIDWTDWLDAPRGFVLGVLRVLWWLAWEVCIETVAWSVGWCVMRVLTWGRYPAERLGGVDEASTGTAIVVGVTGLLALALAIWGLSGLWP